MSKFFEYVQNNSGGSFDRDEEKGIGEYVIIEALNSDHANERAEKIGLYFDGYGDCSCCGNRWSETYEEGSDIPSIYNTPVFLAKQSFFRKDVFVHYLDGTIEKIDLQPNKRK